MLIPATRYYDCNAAYAFLTGVLGLTELAAYRDDNGSIQHCELSLGTGVMMFGPMERSTGASEFNDYMTHPSKTDGRETVSIYAVAGDVAARYDRVVAAKAEVLIALRTETHGGTSFSIRDPEGHIWTVGSYDPFHPPKPAGD
jgi:uncharacterized glyoxalase superfamily protein PhnB